MSVARAGSDGTLRLGVVGVGVMGANHARVLADLAGVKLVGIADSDREQRELVAQAARLRRLRRRRTL